MNLSCKIILLLALGSVFAVVANATASTPFDYKERLDKSIGLVDELREYLSDEDRDSEVETVEVILEAIPPTEKIEWPGGSLEVDNQWLKSSLDEFEKESDIAARENLLTSVSERLAALSVSVGELDLATKAESTKDADKQRLAEILSRQEYQKPEAKEESLFQKWWREFWEWLRKQVPEPNISPGEGLNLAPLKLVLQIIVFAAVIGLVLFLLWRFVPYASTRFRLRARDEKGDRVILGETIGDDESATDIFAEAERLALDGDLRGAIRKGYIAVLCELGDRKIVRLARHKTNRDYLRDVRKRERIYDGMSGLTSNFERNWYGLREAQPSDWEEFRACYHATVAEVKGRA
ncbi:MAG: DUF4129 domain-containing protein [Pyrinomonadaceae bacterium]